MGMTNNDFRLGFRPVQEGRCVTRAAVIVGVLFSFAAPAAAQATDPAGAAAPTAATAPPSSKDVSGVTVTAKKAAPGTLDPKEVICHKEPVLGSLFPKEICASREARAERTREDQKDLRDSLLYRPLKSR
jgi:hypothetical protein